MDHYALECARAFGTSLSLSLSTISRKLEATATEGFLDETGTLDRDLSMLFHRVLACRRYTEMHRPAVLSLIDPIGLFRQWNPALRRGGTFPEVATSTAPVNADARQVSACLDSILLHIRDADRGDGAHHVYLDTSPAGVHFEFSPEVLPGTGLILAPGLTLAIEDLSRCWATATQGGEIHWPGPGELVLRWAGDAPPSPGIEAMGRAATALHRAERALMPWRGATGTSEPGYLQAEEARVHYRRLLERAAGALAEVASELRPAP